MSMTTKEKDELLVKLSREVHELHDDVHYMRHKVSVNGRGNTQPVVGLDPVLKYLTENIYELKDLTADIRANRNFRKAAFAFAKAKGFKLVWMVIASCVTLYEVGIAVYKILVLLKVI